MLLKLGYLDDVVFYLFTSSITSSITHRTDMQSDLMQPFLPVLKVHNLVWDLEDNIMMEVEADVYAGDTLKWAWDKTTHPDSERKYFRHLPPAGPTYRQCWWIQLTDMCNYMFWRMHVC